MIDLGTVKPGSTIRIPFSSFDKDDGSSITMTNYAAADILIYKDGGTTERASTAGFTATTDFDAKTGKHVAVIDLADNTTAGFYSAGSEYMVAIDSVTVDAVTTGGWIARFRIGYPNAALDTTIATLASQTSFTLTNGPAEDDALNGFTMMAHDVASSIQAGMAYVLDYTGSTKTVTLVAGPTFTMATTDNVSFFPPIQVFGFGGTAGTFSGGRPEVNTTHAAGTAWGSGAITAASIASDAITAAKIADGAIDAGAIASDAITAAKIATGAITAAKFAAGAIDAAALAADAGAEIADAVWDEVITGAQHNVTNSAAKFLREASEAVALTGTAQAGANGSITLAAGASASNDIYKGEKVEVIEGTGAGQSRLITAYNGTSKVATIDRNWVVNPDSTSVYAISGADADVQLWRDAQPAALADTDKVSASVQHMANNVMTAAAANADLTTEMQSGLATAAALSTLTTTIGTPDGASVSEDVAAIKTDTGNLVTRIPAALFSGITSLAHWLGALAGKQAANATAQTEIRATGAGSGTYDPATDSQEAIRDRGDAAWTTATGFSTHSAADVWAVATRAITDKSGFRLSTTGVADIWAYVIEGTWTAVQFMRLFASALLAKCSGMGTTTAVFRDVDDTKNRLSVTVDVDGNRSAFGTRDGD